MTHTLLRSWNDESGRNDSGRPQRPSPESRTATSDVTGVQRQHRMLVGPQLQQRQLTEAIARLQRRLASVVHGRSGGSIEVSSRRLVDMKGQKWRYDVEQY